MNFRRWLAAGVLAFAPVCASSATVQFASPAGNLPVEHLRNAVYDAVLPSGRIVTPFGESVVSGMSAEGAALTPDGRYAVVSNDAGAQALVHSGVDPQIFGGYSIAVIDTATMHVVDRFSLPGEAYAAGIIALADPRDPARSLIFVAGGANNRVDVFDLDRSGHISPDARHVIPIPGPLDPAFADFGRSFPAMLVASHDGRRVYAIDEGGNSVAAIDTATRTIAGMSTAVGFSPFGAALSGDRLLVANEGSMRYARVADGPGVPPFSTPPADPSRTSSLSFVALGVSGDFGPPLDATADALPSLPMDITPDGLRVVGGAHPSAIAVTPDTAYAFVAMTSVDRIATVRLGGTPAVAGGTELRFFDRGPYGTQPAALALSHDGTRLYVALAGLDAVAVLDARDPLHLHRLGLIPTGWDPSALALAPDDRTLYVVNTKGFGHDSGVTGGTDPASIWSTLQKIDLGAVTLSSTTLRTLENTRETHSIAPVYPPALRNVVVILAQNTTFDALLGDSVAGIGDPSDALFSPAITPNLHALAHRYALAGNIFADAQDSDALHQFAAGGIATVYSERMLCGSAACEAPSGHGEDPQDYPRAGSIYANLARHNLSFREYGDSMRLSGYEAGATTDPVADVGAGFDDPNAPTLGLGGRYTLDVPAPAILAGHVDLMYPGWNVHIRNERRAREFVRDYSALVTAHRQPRYTHIWLPADERAEQPGLAPRAERVAQSDRALGTIVQYLSHLRSWKSTAIFVMSDGVEGSRDHIDASRTYAVVISPFAKRHYVGMRHLSTVSVVKTSEELLALPPMSLGDLLATDMSDFFTPTPDMRPFVATDAPVQTADGDAYRP